MTPASLCTAKMFYFSRVLYLALDCETIFVIFFQKVIMLENSCEKYFIASNQVSDLPSSFK